MNRVIANVSVRAAILTGNRHSSTHSHGLVKGLSRNPNLNLTYAMMSTISITRWNNNNNIKLQSQQHQQQYLSQPFLRQTRTFAGNELTKLTN